MSELVKTHRDAVTSVLKFITSRGFGVDRFRFQPHESIRVTSHQGKSLSVPFVHLQVHGSTQPPTCAVQASERQPINDAREMVVCCWLGEPPGKRLLFLTNQEARDLWHRAGTRHFYWTNEDLPEPDDESIRKILEVGSRP